MPSVERSALSLPPAVLRALITVLRRASYQGVCSRSGPLREAVPRATVIGSGMTVTKTVGNLMCPEHEDALPEGGYEKVNLRDGLAGMVGEGEGEGRGEKDKLGYEGDISFENPKLILYLNNPVMTVNFFVFLNFYSCNCMFVLITACVYAEQYLYICV